MFGFHLGIMHISRNETYDDNNKVMKSICKTHVFGPHGLQWMVNEGRFRIVGENITINS
jgi:hypothetical protein